MMMDSLLDGHEQVVIKAGPCGDLRSGESWEEPFPGFIDRIFVSHGASIRSIQILYKMVDGEMVLMDKHGGQGEKFTSIQFENGECITKVSGHLSYWLKNVKSLKFETDRHIYGPYGKEKGTPFIFEVNDGIINGLHGRSSKTRLNAIGVLINTGVTRPVQQRESSASWFGKTFKLPGKKKQTTALPLQMMAMPMRPPSRPHSPPSPPDPLPPPPPPPPPKMAETTPTAS